VSLAGWSWRNRACALEPQAALGWGAARARLHARLEKLTPPHLARLFASANRDFLIVAGATADLPWAEGVAYAAPCPDVPQLWLPTQREPNMAAEPIAQAFCRHFGRHPLLLWPDPACVLPLDRLLPLTPELLTRIFQESSGK
jgi:hypothetical protein